MKCSICKYGCMHDYVPNHYYCNHPTNSQFFNDKEEVTNCDVGIIDNWKKELFDKKD